MAKKIRLTRKDLKEDEVRSFWNHSLEWLQQNNKTLLIGVGIAAVLSVVVVIIQQRKGTSDANANRLIAEAQGQIFDAINAEDNQKREGFFAQAEGNLRTLVDMHGRSQHAPHAYYLLGNVAFFRNEYEVAEGYYRDYLGKVDDDLDKADGYIALGYTYENRFFWTRQKPEDRVWLQRALDSYLEAETLTSGTMQRYLAMLGRARLYDLQENRIDQAKELYEQIARERKLDEVVLSDQAKRSRYSIVLEQIETMRRLFTLAETARIRLDRLEGGD